MRFRWTIDELKSFSDYRFLAGIVNERLSELNPYSPLAKRLKEVQFKLEHKENLTKDVN